MRSAVAVLVLESNMFLKRASLQSVLLLSLVLVHQELLVKVCGTGYAARTGHLEVKGP